MVTIDGAIGEGGGQVLRTALTLSMITGEALAIRNIRANRKKPGLMRQHRTAAYAAEQVCGARVEGDAPGSTELEFKPGKVKAGSYSFAIGTAGSATLVLQTVLPALLAADGDSYLVLEGGTHNPLAPPFDFLEKTFLPLLARMGGKVTARLQRYGFYPAGGGKLIVEISGSSLSPLFLTERPEPVRYEAECLYANLPAAIAKREAAAVMRRLGIGAQCVKTVRVDSPGPGNAVLVSVIMGEGEKQLVEVFTSFGEKGTSSEAVAETAADQAKQFAAASAAVGPYAADQILLPLALAGEGEFTTTAPTLHTKTNVQVIETFLPVTFSFGEENNITTITCRRKQS